MEQHLKDTLPPPPSVEYLDGKTVSALQEEGRIILCGKTLDTALVSEDCFPVVLRGNIEGGVRLFLTLDKIGTSGVVDLSFKEILARQIYLHHRK